MTDIVGVDTTQVDTTAKFDLAKIVRLDHATYGRGAWVYGQADEAIAAGEFVFVAEDDGGLTLLDTTESGTEPQLVGAADAAIASGSYGWVWVGEGTFEAEVDDSVTAGSALTTIATAGEAGTGGDTIAGLTNVDAGVDGTRVTVEATGIMRTN
jgi:hypothetical protein